MLIITDKEVKKRFIKSLIILFIIMFLGLFYGLFLVDYVSIPCIFTEITGFHCPGCGLTRALISIINFEFIEALQYNRLVYLIIIVIGTAIYRTFYQYIFKKDLKPIPSIILILLLIIFIGYGVLRNIPGFNL